MGALTGDISLNGIVLIFFQKELQGLLLGSLGAPDVLLQFCDRSRTLSSFASKHVPDAGRATSSSSPKRAPARSLPLTNGKIPQLE